MIFDDLGGATPGTAKTIKGLAKTRDHGDASDIMRFPVGRGKKVLHKYKIANAFLRHAASQPFEFVGRTEDDALINVSWLGWHLQRLKHPQSTVWSAPSASTELLLYGVRGSWVMWDRVNMLPVCWNMQNAHAVGAGACDPARATPFVPER